MKRFLCVLILIAVVACSAFSQAGSQNGRIRELTGDVEYKLEGASNFVRASAGDTIALNTLVSTGFRSTAIIEIGGTLVTVRPLTRLSLSEIQRTETSENVNVNLQSGRVRVDVNPPAGARASVRVQSPSATASVRGTSFDFDTVNLSVDEGRVIFQGNAGPAVIIDAGSSSFIVSDTTSADPANVIIAALLPPPPLGTPPAEVLSSSTSTDSTLVEGDFEFRF